MKFIIPKENRDLIRKVVIDYIGDREIFALDMYEDGYSISNFGRVLNLNTGKILKPSKNDKGYYSVKYYVNGNKKTMLVHRLVMRAFLPNCEDYEVNHMNTDKSDNKLVNLELMTRSENLKHAKENGCYKSLKMEESPSFKFTKEIVDNMIEMKKSGSRLSEIATKYNTSISYTCTMIKQRLGGNR